MKENTVGGGDGELVGVNEGVGVGVIVGVIVMVAVGLSVSVKSVVKESSQDKRCEFWDNSSW